MPTGTVPSAVTTVPPTFTAEPAFANTLLGTAITPVATAGGACSSTSTATERAGTVNVPVAASHAVVFTTGSAPFACASVSANSRPASPSTCSVIASGDDVEHDQGAVELGVDVVTHEVVDLHHDEARRGIRSAVREARPSRR